MQYDLGKQYDKDDRFRKQARFHQSYFRKNVLSVDYDEYGNRLEEDDGKKLLNYYEHLNVRKALRDRYPNYSHRRDADMLRSEHIPFNLFGPLKFNFELAKDVISKAFSLDIKTITMVEFEYAPKPKSVYLNDATAFDTYIAYKSTDNNSCGIGIEVKYTEKSYKTGGNEKANIENPSSNYWKVTNRSGIFKKSQLDQLIVDDMRQIWRNHILGLSMVQNGDIKEFTSVIVYPSGNGHFQKVIPIYRSLLIDPTEDTFRGCTFENYIASIPNEIAEIEQWKDYLNKRYIVQSTA